MKQGQAPKVVASQKVEPKPQAVNPGWTAQLGEMVGNRRAIEHMDAGRGFKAPGIRSGSSNSGSQGKH
jgi:hypothetical protein